MPGPRRDRCEGPAHGAAGPFVVLMIWIYYSTQMVLLAAEFTRAYARPETTGSETPRRDTLTAGARAAR